jgi:hypothetical protein
MKMRINDLIIKMPQDATPQQTLPTCSVGQFLQQNASGWTCVDSVFNNQIDSVPLGNFTNDTGGVANVDCNIDSASVAKLSDSLYINGVYCKDKSATINSTTPASVLIDLGKVVKNGMVYIDVNMKKTANSGTNQVPFFVSIYSSVDGTNYNQVDSVSIGSTSSTTSFIENFLSGTFNGKYLKISVFGQADEEPNGSGSYHNSQGEAYINEVEIYAFTK